MKATRECPRCSTQHSGQQPCAQTLTRLLRFRAMVGDCWEFTGARNSHGYGKLWIRDPERRCVYAHRYSYELHKGPIPDGLQLDHLCRNRACFNPEHLEAVTSRVNILRSDTPNSVTVRTNTCPQGHDMTDAYVRPDTNRRMCRECKRQRAYEYNLRRGPRKKPRSVA